MLVTITENPPTYTAWQYKGGDPITDIETPESIKSIIIYTHSIFGENLYVRKLSGEMERTKEVFQSDWIISKDTINEVITDKLFREKYKVVENTDGNIS